MRIAIKACFARHVFSLSEQIVVSTIRPDTEAFVRVLGTLSVTCLLESQAHLSRIFWLITLFRSIISLVA